MATFIQEKWYFYFSTLNSPLSLILIGNATKFVEYIILYIGIFELVRVEACTTTL